MLLVALSALLKLLLSQLDPHIDRGLLVVGHSDYGPALSIGLRIVGLSRPFYSHLSCPFRG